MTTQNPEVNALINNAFFQYDVLMTDLVHRHLDIRFIIKAPNLQYAQECAAEGLRTAQERNLIYLGFKAFVKRKFK